MIKKSVPLFIIKLLVFGTHVRECLYAGAKHVPPVFVLQTVLNRAVLFRQCFFNLYMDDLSVKLNCFGIGGYIGISFINYFCYDDDLCLLVCLLVACNICLIFVKSMHSHISYYITDQSHVHYISRKKHTESQFFIILSGSDKKFNCRAM